MAYDIQLNQVHANGIDFSFLECGTGPLALCVHGFPDSAHTWRHLLPELAKAGYRAVAPFTRGYAPTSIPLDHCYQTGALAADVNALHQALGGGHDAVLIGHDWGASTVYVAGANAPDRWRRVVALSVPPGLALRHAFQGNLAQIQRSWYMFYFQSALAETAIPANDYALIDLLWKKWSPGLESPEDQQNFQQCVADPENLKAALGYYRASLGSGPRTEAYNAIQNKGLEPLTQPVLYLHGREDGCIGADLAELAQAQCPWLTVEILDGVGHFMQLEKPQLINQRITDFLHHSI
jgi:pimeloyl-ACP methyl ester carboxylesterase